MCTFYIFSVKYVILFKWTWAGRIFSVYNNVNSVKTIIGLHYSFIIYYFKILDYFYDSFWCFFYSDFLAQYFCFPVHISKHKILKIKWFKILKWTYLCLKQEKYLSMRTNKLVFGLSLFFLTQLAYILFQKTRFKIN